VAAAKANLDALKEREREAEQARERAVVSTRSLPTL